MWAILSNRVLLFPAEMIEIGAVWLELRPSEIDKRKNQSRGPQSTFVIRSTWLAEGTLATLLFEYIKIIFVINKNDFKQIIYT